MYVPATAGGSHTWTGSHAKHAVLAVPVLAICPGQAMHTPSSQPALISSIRRRDGDELIHHKKTAAGRGLIGDDAHAKRKSPSF